MKQPFEGDTKLAELVEHILKSKGVNCVIETGTETGATANWFAERVDKVYTCDINDFVDRDLHDNVSYSLCPSHRLLDNTLPLYSQQRRIFFWLDAHNAPTHTALPAELEVISRMSEKHAPAVRDSIIAIHDFLVPTHPELGFDAYVDDGPLCKQMVEPWMNRIYPDGWHHFTNEESTGGRRGVGFFHPK